MSLRGIMKTETSDMNIIRLRHLVPLHQTAVLFQRGAFITVYSPYNLWSLAGEGVEGGDTDVDRRGFSLLTDGKFLLTLRGS